MIPARHRVVAKEGSGPRLAAWHELCTSKQLSPPMLAKLARQGLELRHGLVRLVIPTGPRKGIEVRDVYGLFVVVFRDLKLCWQVFLKTKTFVSI